MRALILMRRHLIAAAALLMVWLGAVFVAAPSLALVPTQSNIDGDLMYTLGCLDYFARSEGRFPSETVAASDALATLLEARSGRDVADRLTVYFAGRRTIADAPELWALCESIF
jgi:hypothetical protein